MTHGGKRDGAGRPAGARNIKTVAVAEKAAASGLMPLDYLLSVMRDENVPRDERVDAAHKAAPYVHAKLSSIEHSGKNGADMQVIFRTVYEAAPDGIGG